jgi:hypothetical protein
MALVSDLEEPLKAKTPRERNPGRFVHFSGGSGRSGLHRIDPPYRLAVALAQKTELGLLFFAQTFVPVCDVSHGVVEPILLVLRQGVNHPTAENVTE